MKFFWGQGDFFGGGGGNLFWNFLSPSLKDNITYLSGQEWPILCDQCSNSFSSVVRALVCQLSGPGSILGVSLHSSYTQKLKLWLTMTIQTWFTCLSHAHSNFMCDTINSISFLSRELYLSQKQLSKFSCWCSKNIICV